MERRQFTQTALVGAAAAVATPPALPAPELVYYLSSEHWDPAQQRMVTSIRVLKGEASAD